jgi:hypothetical protein
MQTSNRVFALIPCSLAWPKTLADRGGNGAQLLYIEAFNRIFPVNISSHLYINAAWREMDSNHRYRKISHRFETDFCRLHLHDGSRSRKGFTSFATGDRQFEFTSLQRGVSCEPEFSQDQNFSRAWT